MTLKAPQLGFQRAKSVKLMSIFSLLRRLHAGSGKKLRNDMPRNRSEAEAGSGQPTKKQQLDAGFAVVEAAYRLTDPDADKNSSEEYRAWVEALDAFNALEKRLGLRWEDR